VFSVSDSGIGIPEDSVAAIFDPYSQADASVSRKFGGTGLGTAISRQLVELMGGSIAVSSEVGVGSTFTFRLPLNECAETRAANRPAQECEKRETQSDHNQNSLRILVADDVPLNVELLTIVLERAGHEVVSVNNGQLALNCAMKDKLDVILMDLQMPKMDGCTAARKIREYEQKQNAKPTPIIALTAGVMEEERLAASEAGMDDFVTKPVDLKTLELAINKAQKRYDQWEPRKINSASSYTTELAHSDQARRTVS